METQTQRMLRAAKLVHWHLLIVGISFFVLTFFTQAAHAKRVALVVGNSSYSERPLRNPVNDANLMQAALKDLGFEVTLLRNADRRSLLAGLRDFEGNARDAEVALFFFAGHGAQVGGNNYLIPVGGNIQGENDVPDEAVDASSVLRRLEDARSKVAVVILDACRDNPFAGASRSASRGLSRMSVPTGTIVAFATAPGSTAADGTGSNGVYTEQLVRQLKTPNLDIKDVFDRTAQEVERITNGKQRPREEIGLRGRFVLNGVQVASIRPEPTSVAPQLAQPSGLSMDDLEKEDALRKQWAQWQTRMKADFDRVSNFGGNVDLQAKAWGRFIEAWAQDNPLSQEDDVLRGQAQARQERALQQESVPAPQIAVSRGLDLKVAVDPTYEPFTFRSPSGKPTGFDVDIANALCEQIKRNCVFVEQPWDGMIPGLTSRKYDVIISSMSITESRLKQVDFTDKYYNTPSKIVIKKDILFDSPASLIGKKIGVLKASTQEKYALSELKTRGAEVISYDSQDQVYRDMSADQLHGTVADVMEVGWGFLSKPAGKNYQFAGPALYIHKYFGVGAGIALKKGQPQLKSELNAAIAAIRSNGKYKAINDKYFKFDVYGE